MKRFYLSLAAIMLSSGGCFGGVLKGLGPIQLNGEQEAILVEETNPYRNEWLHDHCQIKDVKEVLSPKRAKYRASQATANYVEVLYADSPFHLYTVMFACPEIPPY